MKKFIEKNKRLLLGILAFTCFQVLVVHYSGSKENKPTQRPTTSVDTFVPLGFTLVPIQLENHNEFQSLIENFAIVDLHKKGVPDVIASGVRLLRSPNNPDVFAVLVEQDKARQLISQYGAQFTVSLRSPNSEPAKKVTRRIIIKE